MSESIFLEIVLQRADFTFGGRHEIGSSLDDALQNAELGEVTGGGTGMDIAIIDVNVLDLDKGLTLIREVLQGLCVASSTFIKQYEPQWAVHRVYD